MDKIYYIVLDGAADHNLPQLNDRTPLQAATTPYLDLFAVSGQQSMIEILPKGITPETDSGIMSLLGYDPLIYYCGRGALECIGLGKCQKYKFFAGFRINFASQNEITGQLDRRTARDLSDAELTALSKEINKNVNLEEYSDIQFELTAFGAYRGILCFYSNHVELSGNVSNTDPGFRRVGNFSIPVNNYLPKPQLCVPLDQSDAAKITADLVNHVTIQCQQILTHSYVNQKRRQQGRPVANCIIVRDGGSNAVPMQSFEDKYHKSLTIYGQLPCEAAIASLLKADFAYTRAFNLELEEESLIRIAHELAGNKADVIFCHLKGPDEPGHDQNPFKKKAAIEKIDRYFFSELKSSLQSNDCIIVSCDHATPCDLGIHSDDKVPLLIYGVNIFADKTERFDELNAAYGSCPVNRAINVLDYVCGGEIGE